MRSCRRRRQRELDRYRDGVNAGLADLRVRPWEYLLLGSQPQPWRPEDSALVIAAMYLDLNSDGRNERELRFAQMRAVLPAPLVDFLLAPDPDWEAPLSWAAVALAGDSAGRRVRPAPARTVDALGGHGCRAGAGAGARCAASRQQQFRRRRRTHRQRLGDAGERHAPGPARAEHLVPHPPALSRRQRTGRPARRQRRQPARHAGDRGRLQRPDRLGLHQQLWRLAGLGTRAA